VVAVADVAVAVVAAAAAAAVDADVVAIWARRALSSSLASS
jgi:hypothetical protein